MARRFSGGPWRLHTGAVTMGWTTWTLIDSATEAVGACPLLYGFGVVVPCC